MKSTKKMCSTNIDEIIKLPVVNCLIFLWLSTNLCFTKVYLKVSTSLQSESTYKKKNKPLKKVIFPLDTHKTQINLSKIEKKVIKQDFTLINHLYTQIESNHLASDPRVIRLFRKDFISNKHLNMRGTHHFIQIIVNTKVFFDQSNFYGILADQDITAYVDIHHRIPLGEQTFLITSNSIFFIYSL